ncbi:imidazoleglycerol phosphate synthase, cyclase subunit [Candidatus Nasuia deltocephalinicola str. NAS-ALF]|uniref:imidazole glycerol-phosphate synthase n=1 Tax=Candidatus Nasuia deltocephalinicola str. NAS-ALF TaxID=1343077 RepID=S5SPZ4_9PROT|nr:imidazoleglycerol phosphate synthase, cyclase subunit [Candidatus Nasuia deltocephalinicola str. NAS-ALF]
MNFKRIIACLDFFNGRIIKGIKFNNLIDIGDPLDVAEYYNDNGADELVILDVSASIENKSQTLSFINKICSKITVPLTVGGGVKSLEDFKNLFNSGADKISINSHIINKPEFIKKIKFFYGSQCIIAALDIKRIFIDKNFIFWKIYKKSGKTDTKYNLFDLILKFSDLGVGEFLITSIDRDGTKLGFDKELLEKISNISNLNIIASGGGGGLNSILEVLKIKNINSLLLASIIHNKFYTISHIKAFLLNSGINVKF